jgi:hypothetical protein
MTYIHLTIVRGPYGVFIVESAREFNHPSSPSVKRLRDSQGPSFQERLPGKQGSLSFMGDTTRALKNVEMKRRSGCQGPNVTIHKMGFFAP